MKLADLSLPVRGAGELAAETKSLRDYVYNEAQVAGYTMIRRFAEPHTQEDRQQAFMRYVSSPSFASWWRNTVLVKKRAMERRFNMDLMPIVGDLNRASKEGFLVGFGS